MTPMHAFVKNTKRHRNNTGIKEMFWEHKINTLTLEEKQQRLYRNDVVKYIFIYIFDMIYRALLQMLNILLLLY